MQFFVKASAKFPDFRIGFSQNFFKLFYLIIDLPLFILRIRHLKLVQLGFYGVQRGLNLTFGLVNGLSGCASCCGYSITKIIKKIELFF